MSVDNVWALVLAAGEGTRLKSLTTTAGGLCVPKQFCSLRGGASLLEDAITRARSVTTPERTLAVVARSHRQWWKELLLGVPAGNAIVQPENRGTAPGLLLPLLHILKRDPDATVLVLPSDHFVHEEATLARILRKASRLASGNGHSIYMLGLQPSEPDPEFGYIVPTFAPAETVAGVHRFVEKPAADLARQLIEGGALLNMFILAASVRALVELYMLRYPGLVREIGEVVDSDVPEEWRSKALETLYASMSTLDFSRDVVEGQEPRLRVLAVPRCGWSDLGTPRRVAETLSRVGGHPGTAGRIGARAFLSLADQHFRTAASPPSYAVA